MFMPLRAASAVPRSDTACKGNPRAVLADLRAAESGSIHPADALCQTPSMQAAEALVLFHPNPQGHATLWMQRYSSDRRWTMVVGQRKPSIL